jgi:hypothetical protein
MGVILAASASPASGVTIGQLAPEGSAPAGCGAQLEVLQPTVTSGNQFVVPSTGGVTAWRVTSWSTRATSDPNQSIAMKIFRKVGDPDRYMVVGHEGPHTMTTGINTFTANFPVNSGDVLGLHSATTNNSCAIQTADSLLFRQNSNLADGESGDFLTDDPFRVNATAEVTPSNDFTFGKLKRKNNGTAILNVNVPNPGELSASGKGVKGSAAAVAAKQVSAGTAKLRIRAKGKKKAKLGDTGKVTVKPKISFTPTGGTAFTLTRKVKLRRK